MRRFLGMLGMAAVALGACGTVAVWDAAQAHGAVIAQPDSSTATAALTIHAAVGWGSASRTVVVLTSGLPPTTGATLVDDSGEHAVEVQTDGISGCDRAPRLRTGLGTDQWCMRLTNIAPGQPFKGVLHGAATSLTLTVAAHHTVWPLPAGATLGALLVALGLLFLTTRFLPDQLTHWQLRTAKADDAGIAGLRTWANDANGRLAEGDILARLRWAKRYGKGQVSRARAHLATVLDDPATRLPPCPLRTEADAERNRQDITAADLLTPAGARATSKAEQLLQLVEQAGAARAEFDEIADALIAQLAGAEQREQAQALKEQKDDLAQDFLSPLTMDTYQSGLRDYIAQIQQYVTQARQAPAVHAMVALSAAPATRGGALGIGGAAPLAATVNVAVAVATVGATVIVAVILMIVAAGTVLAAQYLTNPTFGTWEDYLGLILTALGSSSVAGILALLLLFRGPRAWYA